MITNDEGTAATQDENGGDANATGTSQTEDRNGEVDVAAVIEENKRLKAANAQGKAEKETLERLKRENEELRTGAGSRTPDSRALNDDLTRVGDAIRQTEDLAQQGDGPSIVLLQALRLQQQNIAEAQLSGIPEEERADVRGLWNTGQFGSIEAARDAYWGRQARLKTQERTKGAEKERETIGRREDDEVALHAKGISSSQARSREMTVDQYNRKLADLPMEERIKLVQQRRTGALKIKY